MEERLEQQLAFALEIDKEKNIFRQTHLSGHGRRENDAEHGSSAIISIVKKCKFKKLVSISDFEI